MKNSFYLNQRKSYTTTSIFQRNSSSSINQRQSQLTYSLKPKRYNIPKDVVPFDIFKNLLLVSKKYFPSIPKIVNLKPNEQDNRSKIVYQIKNFIEKYNLNITSYFYTVYLMDQLLAKKINLNIDKLGFGCLLLGTKFIEIDGKLPSMQSYLKYILNRRICLKKLEYHLSFPQPINFLNIFLLNGIVFNTDENDSKKRNITCSIYMKPYDILSELISLNADYLKYHPLELACACIAFARESYKLSKWHYVFEKIFGIYESKFNDAYNFVRNFNEEKKKIIEKNEQLKKERKKIEMENYLYHTNSCSTSNILTGTKKIIYPYNNISNNIRNGIENDTKTIYYKTRMSPLDNREKEYSQKRKERISLDITIPYKNRENSINLHDTAETSDLSISLKSHKTNNNNNEFIKINSQNKYYYNDNYNYKNIIVKNITTNQSLTNISKLSIPHIFNNEKRISQNSSYPRREIYSSSGRINTNTQYINSNNNNNNINNILSRERNSSTLIESYSTKTFLSNSGNNSNNNSSSNINSSFTSNNNTNYNSYNNRNYVNLKLRGGSIVSSYQIKEIPISFNRTLTNTDSNLNSISRRIANNKYAYLFTNKNIHK